MSKPSGLDVPEVDVPQGKQLAGMGQLDRSSGLHEAGDGQQCGNDILHSSEPDGELMALGLEARRQA